MRIIFTYNKADGRVAGYSDGKNKVDETKFLQLEYNVTDEEFKKLQQNYVSKVVDGKLVLEPSLAIIDESKQEKMRIIKKQLIEKGDNVTTKELKDLLLQIL